MNDVAEWKARGPVRTCRREFAEWDRSRNIWQDPRGLTILTFRPDGQLSESEGHNPDGSVARSARVYDDSGRLVETQTWMNDEPRRRVLYAYDAAGRPSGAVDLAPDGTRREAETCRYDDDGRKTKVSFLADHGTNAAISYAVEGTEIAIGAPAAVTSTVSYDDRERPAEVSFHDANQTLVRRIVFSRDRDGRVLTEVVHFGGTTPFTNVLPGADEVPTEEHAKMAALLANVFAEQTLMSTSYAYDHAGRLMERVRRMGSLSEERTSFQYDDHDNPVEEISEDRGRSADIDDDGVLQVKEEEPRTQYARLDYQYDVHGNWTERVGWGRTDLQTDFQRSNIERRTFTYYT
jgi:hypothetical protein